MHRQTIGDKTFKPTKALYSAREASELYERRIGKRRILEMAGEGQLPCRRFGARIYFEIGVLLAAFGPIPQPVSSDEDVQQHAMQRHAETAS